MDNFADFREAMEKEVREFKAQMERDFRYELRELKKSVKFLSDSFEEQKKDLVALKKENKELKEANQKLLNDSEVLKKQTSQLEQRLLASEQYSRNANVEIKGIPVSGEESISDTLHRIGELLHEPINESEVEACHRVPTRNVGAPPNIVVQFKSRAKRNAVLEKAKKARISARDLGHTSGAPVFINEHLCPAMKQLLGMTVAQKKAKGWRFVWVSYGKILAKKDETTPSLHIRNAQDIEKIV